MSKYIISADTQGLTDILATVGGKGANLIKLVQAGADVPDFIILSENCFKEFINSFKKEFDKAVNDIDCKTPASIAKTAKRVRELICSKPIPEKVKIELFNKLRRKISDNDFVAVRSSALGEDSKETSYAGMLDTFLFRRTEKEICDAVVKCWASIFSDRAVAYRNMRNVLQNNVSMAVVVQKMIDGEVSGVTFTVNPVTKYENEMLITSVFGLGEGLVSGTLDSDQFVCIKDNNTYKVVEKHIANKTEKLVFDKEKNYGTVTVNVSKEEAKKPSLTRDKLRAVATVCHRIEKAYDNVPQDIEWTIDKKGSIKILQARPITTIDKPIPSERGYSTIWDNSNIVESYSGVTTPLTFSFAIYAYHRVYVQFCEVLMVKREEIQKNDFAFANMLGFLNGRIYYNLKNWYKLISVLPGYKYNSRFMEGMMGVKVSYNEDENKKPIGFFEKYFCELPRMAVVGLNLAYRFWRTDVEVKKFMNVYTKMYNKYKDFDFNKAPAHKLVDIFNELDNTVLANWKAPIINDFMAMIFYGILDMLMKKWGLNEDPALKNDLLAGQGNVESTLPMRMMQKMARFIAEDDKLKKLFREKSAVELKNIFIPVPQNKPENYKKLGEQIAKYLDKYGYRAMCELKLEEPSMKERPEFLFDMLKNYSAASLPKETDTGEREKELRKVAEQKVRKLLGEQKFLFNIKKIDVLMFVAKWAKKAMAVREYQRFARTKMYGIVSRIFKGIGLRFVERNILDKVEDIFYLTKEEAIEYIVGTARSQKLREIVALRRAEFEEYEKMDELPDRIETIGITYCNDLTRGIVPESDEDDDPDIIRGIGGCSGKVRGKVKVILNPTDDMSLNGEILVAARTDPGWVPLFATASALLVERGSMLSHSVIVSRELGLPAVVGATDVTKKLKTGDVVELDGTTGIVKIISRAQDSDK